MVQYFFDNRFNVLKVVKKTKNKITGKVILVDENIGDYGKIKDYNVSFFNKRRGKKGTSGEILFVGKMKRECR